eukprot:CAMPEP_0173409964 /NCGR_PEP_ID=MMETSP1356-20130122/73458_1 /TAXON_ID=77927 ORGANISM="Hemiselmis virescens, Strain PCC157" /NCGR_SAMPLE_ID=MMETSP1356 /ASSEMBLY_ACC=CAM_ASM_000847 /LENGTH=64 /DNA_ID=CAMNT_0014371527 /DNA_START=6 /DNA_END=200 /DNA_ORIENTATION=+
MFQLFGQQTTQLHTDYMYSFSHNPHTGFADQAAINSELAKSQMLSMKDIPKGAGPTMADMVEHY